MPSQVVQLRVAGLHTNNQYLSQVPDGALLDCVNFNHDRDGILEKRRGFFVYGNTLGLETDRTKEMFSYKGVVLRHYSDTLEYDDGTGNFSAWVGSYTEPDGSSLRMKGQEMNGNFYFTTDSGIKKISATHATNFSAVAITDAGGVKALNLKSTANYNNPGFLPPLSKVAYRVVWAVKDNNNNLILGKPSPISIVSNTSETETCIVDLEFPNPPSTTSDYFYQVYRSAIVTAATLGDLDNIFPEDELYLVVEDYPTANPITLTDITPDDFRAGGALLYTNPVSGEGIAQSNDVPPLAKDITLFKNYAFYANTKTKHNLTLNLLAVDEMVSLDTKLVISNGTTTDVFTFVGNNSVSTIVFATANYSNKSDLKGKYFFVRSASDERLYFVWFDDDGTTVIPSAVDTIGKLGLKVNLASLSATPTNEEIVDTIISAMSTNLDFDGSKTGSGADTTLTITNNSNGNTPTYHISNTSLSPVPSPAGGSVTFNDQTTPGDGEDSALKHILLSSKPTPGQQVEETAKSIVEIINSQSSGAVFADYLSSVNDVPGQILLESRELSDISFYLAMQETTPGAASDFNPQLTPVKSISGFTPTPSPTGTDTTVTSTSHGYINGSVIIIYDNVDINGVYTIFNVTSNTFDITKNTFGKSSAPASVFIGTNVSDNEVSPNRIFFSKLQQPEAVPSVNFTDIGPKDKAIQRIIGLRDSLFVFKDDGIYRLTGSSPTAFSVELFDSSAIIISPDSATVLNNKIYAQTTQGIVSVSDTGVQIESKPIENLINSARLNPNHSTLSFGIASETDRSYFLWTTTKKTDTVATVCLRFNSDTSSWTKWDLAKTCGIVNSGDDTIYLGSSDQNTIEKERKNLDRTDYADREYSVQLGNKGISGNTISSLSSLTNISIGDVLFQTQYLTLSQYNRLLRKLDLDQLLFKSINSITTGVLTTFEVIGHNLSTDEYVLIDSVTGSASSLLNGSHKVTVTDPDHFTIQVNTNIYSAANGQAKFAYEANLQLVAGDDIITGMIGLCSRLQIDIPETTVDTNSNTGFYGTGTFCFNLASPPTTNQNAQTIFNTVADRLNELNSTQFTNYFKSNGSVSYEELVLEVGSGYVNVSSKPTFIVGDITIYKGIYGKITWVPNHAGDPSVLKHISSATILFDNLSFSNGVVKYSTDLSKAYEGSLFNGEGIGMYGQTGFSEEGFGGIATSSPFRLMVPRNKSRCRFISPQFEHYNARENVMVFGTSFTVEVTSERAYK